LRIFTCESEFWIPASVILRLGCTVPTKNPVRVDFLDFSNSRWVALPVSKLSFSPSPQQWWISCGAELRCNSRYLPYASDSQWLLTATGNASVFIGVNAYSGFGSIGYGLLACGLWAANSEQYTSVPYSRISLGSECWSGAACTFCTDPNAAHYPLNGCLLFSHCMRR
jgi:hypothetical protein